MVAVASSAGLTTALAAAQAGDMMVCAAGDYPDNYALTTPGVTVRAAKRGTARFTGRWSVTAPDCTLWGGVSLGTGQVITLAADRARLLRWECADFPFTGDGSPVICTVSGVEPLIMHCTFRDMQARPILLVNGPNQTRALRPTIYGVLVKDKPNTGQTQECIQVGSSDFENVGSLYEMGALLENCLFLRCNRGPGDNETVSVKSSRNRLKNLILDTCRSITNRHGRHNRYERCWVRNSPGGGVGIFGKGGPAELIGCRVDSGTIDLHSGVHSQSVPPASGQPHAAFAEGWRVVGCSGPIRLGLKPGAAYILPALNNAILGHTGAITTQNAYGWETARDAAYLETGTTWAATAGETWLPIVDLVEGVNVGVNAAGGEPDL